MPLDTTFTHIDDFKKSGSNFIYIMKVKSNGKTKTFSCLIDEDALEDKIGGGIVLGYVKTARPYLVEFWPIFTAICEEKYRKGLYDEDGNIFVGKDDL